MQALFVKQIQDNSYYLTSMETSGEDMMKALKEADRDVSKLEKYSEQLSEGGASQEWISMRVVDFKRIGVFEED